MVLRGRSSREGGTSFRFWASNASDVSNDVFQLCDDANREDAYESLRSFDRKLNGEASTTGLFFSALLLLQYFWTGGTSLGAE